MLFLTLVRQADIPQNKELCFLLWTFSAENSEPQMWKDIETIDPKSQIQLLNVGINILHHHSAGLSPMANKGKMKIESSSEPYLWASFVTLLSSKSTCRSSCDCVVCSLKHQQNKQNAYFYYHYSVHFSSASLMFSLFSHPTDQRAAALGELFRRRLCRTIIGLLGTSRSLEIKTYQDSFLYC